MIDIELGDDLLNQVEVTNGPLPENTKTKNLKFDAKGTLHMMCRNDDGKLLKDISVRNTERAPSYSDEVMQEYKIEHENFVKMNRRFNIVFDIVVIAIALSLLFMVFTLIMR